MLLLDQRRLPWKECYLEIRGVTEACRAIREMAVRGAPAIGVAAALALAVEAGRYRGPGSRFERSFDSWRRKLSQTRPTAVNLAAALSHMRVAVLQGLHKKDNRELARIVQESALEYFRQDLKANYLLGKNGVGILNPGAKVLTLCNTGALATSGFGTALGVIREAHGQGKRVHTFACETRPWLQGSRLTAWELEKMRMPYTLIADSAAGFLIRTKGIDLVITGADRITRRGDVANKIGTYNLAVLAKEHRIPFYVAAPLTTFDPNLTNGRDIPIEERSSREITEIRGVAIAPARSHAWNPVFDVTPAEYVKGYVTEKGILKSGEIAGVLDSLQPFEGLF